MARKPSKTVTEGELRILEILWERGEASVRDVTDVLARRQPVAYSTCLTMLRILKEKGYVGYRKEGRAFIYYPILTRREARSRALSQLIRDFFGGSPAALAQNLIDETELDLDELERLRAQVGSDDTKEDEG